jgi:nucleotide-binding universal stress UspA family protein
MIKTILVPVTGYPSDQAALQTAWLAARLFDAQIDTLHVRPDYGQIASRAIGPEISGGMRADEYFAEFEKEIKSLSWRAHRHVAEFCSKHGIPLDQETKSGVSAHWNEHEGDAVAIVTRSGRFHDLIVVGRAPEASGLAPVQLGGLLLGAGRPLLVAPEKAPENLAPTVALAWKECREAAHAVTAAMPFLEKADKVVVFGVHESGDADTTGKSIERLARELRRHGTNVECQVVQQDGAEAGDTLADTAIELRADLLVMGGYGHSRLREYMLGGATRDILEAAPLPVFICH